MTLSYIVPPPSPSSGPIDIPAASRSCFSPERVSQAAYKSFISKAFTARVFDISTKDLGENAQPGEQFYGIHGSNHGRVRIFAGGIPLRQDGQVVGAVGVSGGSGEQDQTVAEAAAAAAAF